MQLPNGRFGAALYGGLAGVGVLFPFLWWVTPLGVGFWLYQLATQEIRSYTKTFFCGWIFGTSKSLVVLIWFWSVYPAAWMGLEPGLFQVSMIMLYWAPAAATLGLGMGVLASSLVWLQKRLRVSWLLVFVSPTLWVGGEIIGAYIFSFYTLGPGSYLNAGFSFGHVGYVLVEHGLLFELSRIGGVYALSFILVLLVMVGVVLQTQKGMCAVFIFCVLVSSWFSFATSSQPDPRHAFAVVNTFFPAVHTMTDKESYVREFQKIELVKDALRADVTYVILPEDFRFANYFESDTEVLSYMRQFSINEKILIDSKRYEATDGTHLRVSVYNSATDEVISFDKQYLVPQGEYIPYVYQALIDVLPIDDEVRTSLDDFSYEPGVDQQSVDVPEYVPPVLFCFDSVHPLAVRSIVGSSNLPVVHLVSHGWFVHRQELLWNQLDAMLAVQAKYNNVPIVRAANEAPAGVYFPDGRIVEPATYQTYKNGAVYILTI